MKIPKKLVITKKLYNRLKNTELESLGWNDYDEQGNLFDVHEAALFLLGAKDGVLTEAIALYGPSFLYPDGNYSDDDMHTGGCEFMPGVTSSELARAYTRLAKKDLTPAAFAHILDPVLYKKRGRWASVLGGALRKSPGMPFICFNPEPTAVIGVNKTGKSKWIPISIQGK
jgi:hypothetical protein